MSSKKASNSPGLCPVKGQKSSLGTQTGYRNEYSSLSLGVTKNSPLNPTLVNQPTSNHPTYILSRDSQDRLRDNKLYSRAVPCELVGDLIFSYPSLCQGQNRAPPHTGYLVWKLRMGGAVPPVPLYFFL
jgi:hypothetical protein